MGQFEFRSIFFASNIPLLEKEGWLRHQTGCREATFQGADGVVRPAKAFRPEDFAELTTPSVRNKVASRLFFDRTATPPFQGGECVVVFELIHYRILEWI
jgi:hypothetical protein